MHEAHSRAAGVVLEVQRVRAVILAHEQVDHVAVGGDCAVVEGLPASSTKNTLEADAFFIATKGLKSAVLKIYSLHHFPMEFWSRAWYYFG